MKRRNQSGRKMHKISWRSSHTAPPTRRRLQNRLPFFRRKCCWMHYLRSMRIWRKWGYWYLKTVSQTSWRQWPTWEKMAGQYVPSNTKLPVAYCWLMDRWGINVTQLDMCAPDHTIWVLKELDTERPQLPYCYALNADIC